MPIVNYVHSAEKAMQDLFASKDISENNIQYLKEFFDAYNVSPARLALFSKHIPRMISKTDDIRLDMSNRQKINRIFKELRDCTSSAYYGTVINVSLRFVKWLNNGQKPDGFKDIKNLSRNAQKRSLKEDDMITWDDGIKMCKSSNSIQMKAIILTQLDGGFRPSEFVDLKYGDVMREEKFLIVHVDAGKTGSRNVVLYKAAPYLQRWIANHPSQQINDPLWIEESISKDDLNNGCHVNRYDYFAMSKRLKKIGMRAGVKKPLDFYNFRHSACRLAKIENLPTELAAEKFGHSVEYFVNTYGRLSRKDVLERHRKAYGEDNNTTKIEDKVVLCSICETVNVPRSEICEKCGTPLTITVALEQKQTRDKEFNQLKGEVERINKIIVALANERKIDQL